MLLKLLNDFAVSRHLLDELAFKPETPVRWIIHLDSKGAILAGGPRETQGRRRNKGFEYAVPKTIRPAGTGQVADFLVDDIGAVFGLNSKPETDLNERAANNLRAKHADFWRQIEEAERITGHEGLKAMLAFHRAIKGDVPSFLRLDRDESPKWMVRNANGEEVRLATDLFTFALKDGTPLITDEALREHWRQVHAREMETAEEEAETGLCLVTGEPNVPIARTHTPMVTGLPKPAKGTGAGIVGFESPSFRSYGFEKSYNAPTSLMVSKGYLLALQYLKSREDHWLPLGPAWLCFWAVETEAASSLFASLLRRPDSLTIRKLMTQPWAGIERPPSDLEKFCAVTLTAAATPPATSPRLVVKDWLQITVGEAVQNLRQWFADLEIEPVRWREDEEREENSPLAMFHLACTTLQRKQDGTFDRDRLKSDLMASLYQAALENTAPPVALLKPILNRFHSNIVKHGTKALYDQSRFALLKLIVNRHHRKQKETHMEIPSQLPANTSDTAYNCGCLLSVLDSLQRAAHEGRLQGASIAERFYGSASTNPNAAFPALWRLHQHHLKKLRQKGVKGQKAAYRIKESITSICARFNTPGRTDCPEFPRTFTLVEQGRFALGFYQQEAARAEAFRVWREKQRQAGKPVAEDDVPEEHLFAERES